MHACIRERERERERELTGPSRGEAVKRWFLLLLVCEAATENKNLEKKVVVVSHDMTLLMTRSGLSSTTL
jgi:hypothetical protein